MSNGLRQRLSEQGVPFREEEPPQVYPGPMVLLHLTRTGPLSGVSVAKNLRAAGVTLREAHAVVSELREIGIAPVRIAESVGLDALRANLRAFGVSATWEGCAA